MADTIGAEEGALKAGANAAIAASGAIRGISGKVEGEVNATRGRWTGLGADEFRGLMQEWDRKTESIVKILDNLAEALGATEQDRAAQEESVSHSVSGLKSAMGA